MKMDGRHIVPLSAQAVAILRDLHPLTGHQRYVFPHTRNKGQHMSRETVRAALVRMGYRPNSETPMTAHGFRGMASTLLHEQGWPSDMIERQLAHSEKNKVKAAYNHAEHLPERRRMMQAWADYLDGGWRCCDTVPAENRLTTVSRGIIPSYDVSQSAFTALMG
jgi:integrase